MRDTITITSKGQTTLPAPLRRKLGLGETGGILRLSFNEAKGELIISRPVSVIELSERLSSYIRPGTEPVRSVDQYYQDHREVRS
ncbi:MAG TPA: hypothetical protein VLI05_01965 [Candidatus Saccharimonadia bacterium]|nr:hypothetical protein [Candidatus Saccharimonadia bacterium]